MGKSAAAPKASGSPRVSVIVPSFQQGKFLRSCLESLLKQTGPVPEIIVLDNLSTDETPAVLTEYASRLSRVEIKRDRGQADALRRGFAMAKGDILGWLNCDDMLMLGAIERAVAALEADPQIDVVYGHCAHMDEAGDFLGYFHYIADYDEEELRNFNDFIPQPSTFFRRSAYERAGGVDPSLYYAMDWDLWCKMARTGSRFRFIPEVLSGARIHQNAKTVKGGWRRFLEVSRVNLRHKTLPLPMIPTLYLLHLVASRIQLSKFGPLYRWLRRLWRSAGGRLIEKKVVLGIGEGPRLVSQPASVRFPVFKEVGEVRFRLGLSVGRAKVTICGEEAGSSGFNYARPFERGHFLAEAVVDVSEYPGALPDSIAVQAVGEDRGAVDVEDPFFGAPATGTALASDLGCPTVR